MDSNSSQAHPVIPTAVSAAGVKPDDHSEDLSVTFPDAIVRLSSLSLRSVVRYQLQTQLWGQPGTAPPLSYNIWDLHKSGPRSAGVCAGLKPPSLYGTLTGRDTSHKILLLTSGRYSPLPVIVSPAFLQCLQGNLNVTIMHASQSCFQHNMHMSTRQIT